jgi:hypothetical protein
VRLILRTNNVRLVKNSEVGTHIRADGHYNLSQAIRDNYVTVNGLVLTEVHYITRADKEQLEISMQGSCEKNPGLTTTTLATMQDLLKQTL